MRLIGRLLMGWCGLAPLILVPVVAAQTANRFATSDSDSGYVHWIELYDAQNNKITPESPRPYSPATTCGRCHDTETISHGFHFQAGSSEAGSSEAMAGRNGQPWVWSDLKTGTHLPLSYREWDGTFHPDRLGISRWQMAAQFGGYLPGGGPGSEANLSGGPSPDADSPLSSLVKNRTSLTGPLLIDCMMCHHVQGSGYSPFAWTDQIKQENFAFAPFAAMGLGSVSGQVRRLKDDFDPSSEGAAGQMPQVQYDPTRFRNDGKVLFNLVRKPQNNACYYCHTQTTAAAVQGQRWLHDEDVHLRAGMACVDCHRNGLDHATVRGFPGEVHPAGAAAAVLSCQGCHLGTETHAEAETLTHLTSRSGKLGAPRPEHRGIPPLHFERMACTACHSGPLPGQIEPQLLAAIHHLGDHLQRTGEEPPFIGAALHLKLDAATEGSAKYAPHRWMWPSYWGIQQTDKSIEPLHPDLAAQWLRRPLKVRQNFATEIAEIKLTLNQRREVLGDERARVAEAEWTADEKQKLLSLEERLRREQIDERLTQALSAIQAEIQQGQAVFVSGGHVFSLGAENQLSREPSRELEGEVAAYFWPIAHNVRPATQSLGAKSCAECHSDDSPFFAQQLSTVGVVPGQSEGSVPLPVPMEGDSRRVSAWNQLMQGRGIFKIFAVLATAVVAILLLRAVITWGWERRTTSRQTRPWFMSWIYGLFVATMVVMGVTSFGSLAQGHELQAWPLLIHVSIAGAFLCLLVVVAYGYLPAGVVTASETGRSSDSLGSRWTAVLMVTACLTTAVVIIPGMFPWLGTSEMLQAMQLHRYAGMAALVTTALHASSLYLGRRSTDRKGRTII